MPQKIVWGLQECDFGAFEGKNYQELSGDTSYQAWIDSGGTLAFPEGESREGFVRRCCAALETALQSRQESHIAAVVHGGTIMGGAFCIGTTAESVFFMAGKTLYAGFLQGGDFIPLRLAASGS